MLKTKYLKDALPGKLDIMNGVTLSLKAGKAKAGDLKELLKPYITRPIPKNVNSKSRQKPTLEYISSQYSKFKSDSIVVPVPITPAVPAAISRRGVRRGRVRRRGRGRGQQPRSTSSTETVNRGRGSRGRGS